MVTVAVGVVCDNKGQVLLQQRQAQQSYSQFWEFPGGKVNDGESVYAALCRELQEEINIQVTRAHAWLVLPWQYESGWVQLHFYRVNEWEGELHGAEGQNFAWHNLTAAPPEPLLPASRPVWKWLQLPPIHAITAAEIIGVDTCIKALPQLMQQGETMIQIRDKNLPQADRRRLAKAIAAQHPFVVINDDEALAAELNCGLHLSSQRLLKTKQRPAFNWLGASCHNEQEIKHAAALGLDYAVLSPVKKTLTHVDAKPIGWHGFEKIAQQTPFPLYALGGLSVADLPTAHAHGAQGIALMRKAWTN